MKKFIVVLFLLIFTMGYSQQLYIGNTHIIEWDAVTTPQGIISYEIWLKDADGIEIFIAETSDIIYTVDISGQEGIINIGVKTKLVYDSVTYHSDINWSNINGVWTPDPFVLWRAVPRVKNLRRQ